MRLKDWKIQVLVLFPCAFLSLSCQNAAVQWSQVGWEQLPKILEEIKPPVFPDRDFVITDYGAIGDGKTKCTEAFKKAVLACNRGEGGRVVQHPGRRSFVRQPNSQTPDRSAKPRGSARP